VEIRILKRKRKEEKKEEERKQVCANERKKDTLREIKHMRL